MNDIGSLVVVEVVLDRRKPEVQDAFTSLENLLLRTAQEQVDQAVNRELIEARAVERSTRLVDAERKRSQTRVVQALRDLRRAMTGVRTPSGEAGVAARAVHDQALSKVDSAISAQERTLERKVG